MRWQIEAMRTMAAAVKAVPLLGVTYLPLLMHRLQSAQDSPCPGGEPLHLC